MYALPTKCPVLSDAADYYNGRRCAKTPVRRVDLTSPRRRGEASRAVRVRDPLRRGRAAERQLAPARGGAPPSSDSETESDDGAPEPPAEREPAEREREPWAAQLQGAGVPAEAMAACLALVERVAGEKDAELRALRRQHAKALKAAAKRQAAADRELAALREPAQLAAQRQLQEEAEDGSESEDESGGEAEQPQPQARKQQPEPEPEPGQARQALSAGDRVEVFGLVAAAQHNGKRGTVQRWLHKKRRYLVRLDGAESPKPIAVKPANLQLRIHEPEPEPEPELEPPTKWVLNGFAEPTAEEKEKRQAEEAGQSGSRRPVRRRGT